jgi:hypothetical protein
MGKGYGIPFFKGSFKAAADLHLNQYHIVLLSATGTVALASAATDLVIGALQNKPEAEGWPAEVVVLGESKLVAGAGGIAAGQYIVADASGHAVGITLGAPGDTTNVAVGRALEAADENDVFRAYIFPCFVQVTA